MTRKFPLDQTSLKLVVSALDYRVQKAYDELSKGSLEDALHNYKKALFVCQCIGSTIESRIKLIERRVSNV